MIRGHVALVRQLRAFMETSGLPWNKVRFISEYGDEGEPLIDDNRAEITFAVSGVQINITIWAPATEEIPGIGLLPLGRLAARCGGEVVKGPIDQTTWDAIVKLIKGRTHV